MSRKRSRPQLRGASHIPRWNRGGLLYFVRENVARRQIYDFWDSLSIRAIRSYSQFFSHYGSSWESAWWMDSKKARLPGDLSWRGDFQTYICLRSSKFIETFARDLFVPSLHQSKYWSEQLTGNYRLRVRIPRETFFDTECIRNIGSRVLKIT